VIREKKSYMRGRRVEVGGWFCPCCGPAPKQRKKVVRQSKRSQKSVYNLVIEDEMKEKE